MTQWFLLESPSLDGRRPVDAFEDAGEVLAVGTGGTTHQALPSSDMRTYSQTVQWAEAAYRAGFDGAAWMSNRCNDTAAVVLFGDRVEADGLSADASVARMFSRQTDRDWLTDICFPLGIHVRWKPPLPNADP